MQPYFFPYLGYWQLVGAVDTFVILDDVNYIVRGWVNRNRILINGEPHYVTVSLLDASQNRMIDEILLDPTPMWRDKMVRSIEMAYRKAPHYAAVFPVLEAMLRHPAERLVDFLSNQLQTLASYLQLATKFVYASQVLPKGDLRGEERILALCRHLGAGTYRNLPGGRSLYDAVHFAQIGIQLEFMSIRTEPYLQLRTANFVPALSVIDALMFVGPAGTREMIDRYETTTGDGV